MFGECQSIIRCHPSVYINSIRDRYRGHGTVANEKNLFNITYMKTFIIVFLWTVIGLTANAKPHCQGFNNYNGKVTIVFTDNQAGDRYTVSDVKLIPSWNEERYSATSVKIIVTNGVVIVTHIFPHITQFSNPKVTLRINGKKSRFKVCQWSTHLIYRIDGFRLPGERFCIYPQRVKSAQITFLGEF